MKGLAAVGVVLLLGLTAGCAGAPSRRLPAPGPGATAPPGLVAGVWTRGPGVYRLRQSVLFEYGSVEMPMMGFMELDTGRKRARLVAMDDLGVKLFDLTVSRDSVAENFLLPKLARPGLAQAVGESVRRIFLSFEPEEGDAFWREPDAYWLGREEGGGELRFRFDPGSGALVEKTASGEAGEWSVRYADYREVGGSSLPGTVVLEDRTAGYQLSLWLEGGKRVDG